MGTTPINDSKGKLFKFIYYLLISFINYLDRPLQQRQQLIDAPLKRY